MDFSVNLDQKRIDMETLMHIISFLFRQVCISTSLPRGKIPESYFNVFPPEKILVMKEAETKSRQKGGEIKTIFARKEFMARVITILSKQ
jgi:hypothetical protein